MKCKLCKEILFVSSLRFSRLRFYDGDECTMLYSSLFFILTVFCDFFSVAFGKGSEEKSVNWEDEFGCVSMGLWSGFIFMDWQRAVG